MKIKISKIKERLHLAGTQYGHHSFSQASARVWHKVEAGMHHIDLPATEPAAYNFWQIWNVRLAVIGGFSAIMLIFGTGIVQAANNSLPGDLLYPVNMAIDNVNEKLIFNPHKKIQFKLKQAEKRMSKVVATSKPHDQSLTVKHDKAVDDFEDSLDASEEYLLLLKTSDVTPDNNKQLVVEEMEKKFDDITERYRQLKSIEYRDIVGSDSEDSDITNNELKKSNNKEDSQEESNKGDSENSND